MDGKVKWVREKADVEFNKEGKAVRGIGFAQDITREEVALRALKESEERFRSLYENSPYGIVICQLLKDENDKAIDIVHLQGNYATEIQTGLNRKDILGKKASEIGSAKEIAEPIKLYEQVVSTGKTASFIQYFPIYNRTLEVTAFPLIKDLFIINFIDITERKRAEQQITGRYRFRGEPGSNL